MGGQPSLFLSDHPMQSSMCTQQEALVMWQFPHPQVLRDWDGDGIDGGDNCRASVHG